MIIGTSDNMVKKITKALGLGQDPDRYIRIEDVATPKEIEEGQQHARLKEGKHYSSSNDGIETLTLGGYLIGSIKTYVASTYIKNKTKILVKRRTKVPGKLTQDSSR